MLPTAAQSPGQDLLSLCFGDMKVVTGPADWHREPEPRDRAQSPPCPVHFHSRQPHLPCSSSWGVDGVKTNGIHEVPPSSFFPLSPAATEAAQVGNPHSVMSPESRRSVPPKTQQGQFSYKPPRALISLISLLLRQQPCSGEITLAGDKLPVSKQH